MAEPNDAAVMLEDASELVQEQYFAKYEEQYHSRFGSTTNKCFMPEPGVVTGDGKSMQYEVGPADTVRFQLDPLGNIASPQRIDPGRIKIRWNRQSSSAHDFTQVSARCQFDTYTIEDGSNGTIVNLADRIYDSIQKDFDEKLAIMRHAGRDGQIALVNGTPRQDDLNDWASCASTPTNSTGMRLKVDTGSIAVIRPNARYDFVRAGVVIAGNVRCTDIPNFADRSAGFEFVSSGITGERSSGNLANVADNDVIVFSGCYNAGIYSFGAYFSSPTEGETFICGADRTDAGSRWMNPQRFTNSGTARPLTKTLFNDCAIACGFFGEDVQNGTVWMADPTQHQRIRDELGEPAFIQIPIGDDRSKRFMNFGSVGLNYQHGTFGTVKIVSDPLARQDRVLVLQNDTWKTLSYAWKGLKPIREGGSHWYRMQQNTPNTGKGLIYAADWVGNVCDWCVKPWKNAMIGDLAVPS